MQRQADAAYAMAPPSLTAEAAGLAGYDSRVTGAGTGCGYWVKC
jgi:hypothetical protein